MPKPENGEPQEEREPLNRAERRAMRRGKRPSQQVSGERAVHPGRPDPVLAPRRAGRRGNR